VRSSITIFGEPHQSRKPLFNVSATPDQGTPLHQLQPLCLRKGARIAMHHNWDCVRQLCGCSVAQVGMRVKELSAPHACPHRRPEVGQVGGVGFKASCELGWVELQQERKELVWVHNV